MMRKTIGYLIAAVAATFVMATLAAPAVAATAIEYGLIFG
jgi:hypothetical protein